MKHLDLPSTIIERVSRAERLTWYQKRNPGIGAAYNKVCVRATGHLKLSGKTIGKE